MEATTIKTGSKLTARSICDNDCIFTAEVVSRNGAFATVRTQMRGESRVKVRTDFDGREYVLALGSYSMAPAFYAR